MIVPHNKIIVILGIFIMFFPGKIKSDEQPNLHIQSGHANAIDSIAVSSDGKYLLSGSYDWTMKLWDIDTKKEIRDFVGHNEAVIAVSFSWNFEAGYDSGFTPIALSADGSRFLYGTADGTITLRQAAEGNVIKSFTGHSGQVLSVAFSPKEKYILSGSKDKTVRLWDVETGEVIHVLTGHNEMVPSAVFSGDGKTAFTADYSGEIKIWDLATGKERKRISTAKRKYDHIKFIIAVYPDGTKAAIGRNDASLELWDLKTGSLMQKMKGYSTGDIYDLNIISSLTFSPDGKYVFSSGSSNDRRTINMWDLSYGKNRKTFGGRLSPVYSLAVSSNGKDLAFGNSNGYVSWLDLTGKRSLNIISAHTKRVSSVDFSPDGLNLLSGSWDSSMKLWDVAEKKIVKTFDTRMYGGWEESSWWINSVDISPDGKYALSGTLDGALYLWDVKTGEVVKVLSERNKCFFEFPSVEFSPDGKQAVTATEQGFVLWDTISGEAVDKYKYTMGHAWLVIAATFSPEGTRVLTGSYDTHLKLWDIDTGKAILQFSGHQYPVYSVAVSSDGKYCLSGSWGRSVRLWDIKGGKEIKSFSGHLGSISAVLFSKDNKYALSASQDGTVRMWNIETGAWVAFMTGAEGDEWLIFDSDGYWDSSPKGGDLVAMVNGLEVWNIDQFAVRNNRPDLILKKLPDAPPEIIEHYYRQHVRRLIRLGLSEENLGNDYHVPEAKIEKSNQNGKRLTLDLSFVDRKEELKSYNIYVNDVPVFGAYGKELSGRYREISETIELSSGHNKIEVSCMNAAGAEAFRAVTQAEYDEDAASDLYFIGFGVSKYQDSTLNLRYADKDVRDLADAFSDCGGNFKDIIVKTYTNEQVTKENIQAVKKVLQNGSVDDTVVLFISGHGIHDRDEYASYYFLSYETDLDDLSETAINFEQLEDLLQGIPPRNKLFLMDTCGSGEWEPEMVQKVAHSTGNKGIFARIPEAGKGLAVAYKDAEGDTVAGREKNPDGGSRAYLHNKNRYIYNDLLRRSGAIVFSSCRGNEVSYESNEYRNGLFTEYILRALAGEGDGDGNGAITTEELRQYVRSAVSRETEGDPLLYAIPQHPTVDRDNIYLEFAF